MPSYKTHFPSTYLQKEDLEGREVRVVIANVASEKLGDEIKMVLYFQNAQKGMVCNRSNAETVAELHGEDTDDWIGREVVIYVDPSVMFAGKRVGGLRLKAAPTRQRTAAPPSEGSRKVVTQERKGYALSTTESVPEEDSRMKEDPGF